MAEPTLIKPIPDQVINELAALNPFDLKEFIQSPAGSSPPVFSAELSTGLALPQGLIITSDGILTGIPAKATHGSHVIIITATNDAGSLKAQFNLTINPSLVSSVTSQLDQLKAQVWDALQQELPIPDIASLTSLPITALDIYYILEHWGTLTIWDAFNLDPPSEKKALHLEGMSEHYNIYDRGSSLIMAPKNLFSQERTINDGIKTAKAMAREIYSRGWTIEMAGLDKWTHAAWVEFQHLGDKNKKPIEIINYTPSDGEMRVYTVENLTMGSR